ncbi:phosphonoacetaldehyde hydrolase [Parendozoicomonas haliclonae]|uniref:Phosphonoacetaldehyde hydrolase n=1 Tax=Parendozoicomonas haliclonae TaxID=1960125 RepID=A0A1X7AQ63_9GAMM|nr:phosphonoacetaldehyde hydrolase [Parendozoicomonas haliclonae]SMA50283.1 Phosphonoacetaldehyde hydrolase [Parendozoicomonas haliclonae]
MSTRHQSWCYQRRYSGPVEAVIMDMAGTVVDFGSMAPVKALCRLFADAGVAITADEARIPMGTHKREHIHALLQMSRIEQEWEKRFGHKPNEQTLDELYSQFIPLQIEVIGQCGDLIPGARKVLDDLKESGVKLAGNTGYNREMLDALLPILKGQGYTPESAVCVDDVSHGRPLPEMCLKNMLDLRVSCVQACVKVDDSCVGIEEGLNAGMWTVGLAISGNEVGLDLDEWQALSATEQNKLRIKAYERLYKSGAHYVVDTIADLPECIRDIEQRLTRGEQP